MHQRVLSNWNLSTVLLCAQRGMGGWWKIWFIPTTLFATTAHVVYMEDKSLCSCRWGYQKKIYYARLVEELNRLFFFCEEYVLVRCALFGDGKVIIFFVVRERWRRHESMYTDIEQVASIRSSEQFFVIEIIQLDNARWRVFIKWFSVNIVCYCACVLFVTYSVEFIVSPSFHKT